MATKLLQPGFPSGPSNCYPLVTPLDTPNNLLLCIKEGENVRFCAKALQRGKIITFGKAHSHKLCASIAHKKRAGGWFAPGSAASVS